MRLAAMFDFWLWSSWLTIKKLTPKINLFYRPSGGQIAKNLVGGLFFEAKKIYMDLLPDYKEKGKKA